MDSSKPVPLKILLIGDYDSRKTGLLVKLEDHHLFKDSFIIKYEGAHVSIKINGEEKCYEVQIWDTSGQEKYRSLSQLYSRNINGVFLVYNIACRETFDSLSHWLQLIHEMTDNSTVIMLIGHQCDSKDQRVVSVDEGITFSKFNKLFFAEISDGLTANDALKALITEIVHRLHQTDNSQFNQANETFQQSTENGKKQSGLISSLPSKRRSLKKDQDQFSVKDCEIELLNLSVSELNIKIDDLKSKIYERDNIIDALQFQLSEKGKEIAKLNSSISAANNEINSLQLQLSLKDNEIDQLKNYLSVLTEQSPKIELKANEVYEEHQIPSELATSTTKEVIQKELTQFDHKTLQEKGLFKLRHPCIVRIFGFNYGDAQHPPSILLSLEPNSLESSIRNHQINNNEKNRIIVEIVLGMRYIHSKDLIHRDLKPANILLSRNKHVRISDFGLAKEESFETSQSKGVGTLRFMAPELLREEAEYTNKVDVYSFGITLIFILMNEYPKFNLLDVVTGKFPELPSTTVEWVIDLIHRCLYVSPEDRPSFADIFIILKSRNFDLFTSSQQQNFKQDIQHRIQKIEAFEYQLQQKLTQNK